MKGMYESLQRWWDDRRTATSLRREAQQALRENAKQEKRTEKEARRVRKQAEAEEKQAQEAVKRQEDLEKKRSSMKASVWVLGRPRPHRGTIPLQEALDSFPRTSRKTYGSQARDLSAFAPVGAGGLGAIAAIFLLFTGGNPLIVMLVALGGIGAAFWARTWARRAVEVGARPVYLVWRNREAEAQEKPLEKIAEEREKARKAILAGVETKVEETSAYEIWKNVLLPVPTSRDRVADFEQFNKTYAEVLSETADKMGLPEKDRPRPPANRNNAAGLPPPGILKQIGEFEDLASALASSQPQGQIKRLIVILLPVLLAIVLVVEVLFLSGSGGG